MTRSGIVFFIILILNALIAAGYLIWHLIMKKDTDNRKQYVMHTMIMLICPVIGILYFFFGFVKYHFVKLGERDLSDVEFSKKRNVARMKADEERERNIVPVEEANIISDQEKKRVNMLNILLGETGETLSAIALALESDDSEVAHYAASFLQSKMDAFREQIREQNRVIQEKKAQNVPYLADIQRQIWDMPHILMQKVLTEVEQRDYVGQLEQLCQELYEQDRSRMDEDCYGSLFQLLLDLQSYEKAEFWAERFAAQYPDQLQPYRMRMKLYFETEQTERFFEVLEQLRASNVEIDHQTLELIRLMQR